MVPEPTKPGEEPGFWAWALFAVIIIGGIWLFYQVATALEDPSESSEAADYRLSKSLNDDDYIDDSYDPFATSASSSYGATVDCDDFATQAEAQQFFNSHNFSWNSDPYHLDEDHDGKACEWNP